MQEVETVAESASNTQAAARPPFSRAQRVVVLGMLLGVLLFAATLCPAMVSDAGSSEYWMLLWCSTWIIPMFFAFFWAAIANRPLAKRVPEGLGLASAFGLAVIWGIHRAVRFDNSPIVFLFFIAVFPMLLAWLPLWLLRKFRGWRFCLEGQDAELPKGRFQFSLLQMLGWTTFMAIILGFASWMVPGQMQNIEGLTSDDYLEFIFYTCVPLFLFAPVFLGSMSLLLSRKIQGKHAVVLFNGSVLSPLVIMVGIALLDAWTTPIYLFSSESADGLKKIYIFEVCGLTLSLVCMTAIRLCGYRLIRVQKTGPRKPTAWRRMGASLAFLSPLRMVRRIPPFPSLIAAILLAAIALCWPARIIHQANEKFARERAVEEERKRIGTPYVPQNQQKF